MIVAFILMFVVLVIVVSIYRFGNSSSVKLLQYFNHLMTAQIIFAVSIIYHLI